MDPGEAPLEDATVEVAGDHRVNETTPGAKARLDALLPDPFDPAVQRLEKGIEGRGTRMTRPG